MAQDKQVRHGNRGDRVSATRVIAEFDQSHAVAQQLDDGADLAACKLFSRPISQQRNDIEHSRRCLSAFPFGFHHNTSRSQSGVERRGQRAEPPDTSALIGHQRAVLQIYAIVYAVFTVVKNSAA
jgi:hypothetical protein